VLGNPYWTAPPLAICILPVMVPAWSWATTSKWMREPWPGWQGSIRSCWRQRNITAHRLL
jgi:hypothetical protein